MLSNAIESAQKKVEGINFQRRKNVLEYDDVMNKQREVIYSERATVLNGESVADNINKMIDTISDSIVNLYCSESDIPDNWDLAAMAKYAENIIFPANILDSKAIDLDTVTANSLKEMIKEKAHALYQEREAEFGSDVMRELERRILLKTVDEKWMDHIDDMDQLKYGIGLRAYGQHDPVVEYKREGFDMFDEMIRNIQQDTVRLLFHIRKENVVVQREQVAKPIAASHGEDGVRAPKKRETAKVGRNDPCPCGSGKKYKKCCGINE
jgi:preprotein translocase subunit SecA